MLHISTQPTRPRPCELFGGPCDGTRLDVYACASSVCMNIIHDMSVDIAPAPMQWKTAKYLRDKSRPDAFVFSHYL